ncbi:hypothetical protein [Marinimicrobium alkaliphilum]|uniref:hypothetical protein n=1 Tax=Marinimicrobium alkaliphilum TaxID=2202654 RepID=UPI000DB9563A|nr:hypothetical protein [Marinimicrobium alkaliphilum]
MMSVDAYKRFIGRGVLLLSGALFVSIAVSYVAYYAFESVAFSIFCFFAIWFVFYYFFGGNRSVRRSIIDGVFGNRFLGCQEIPLGSSGQSAWLKGVGYISDIDQPVWVKVESGGISLYFLSKRRSAPLFVQWSDVGKVYMLDNFGLARIYIRDVDEEIFVPWSDSFNDSVPEFVGISKGA